MIDQDDIQGPDRWGGNRARSRWRWWAVGLAGVTGLALTTVAVAPAAGAVGRSLAAVDDRGDDRGKREEGAGDKGKKEVRPKGVPVPCDADKLIAAITLANARGGAVLDLAKKCTYLLTATIDDGNGLPTITAPITLNGSKHTTITRAAGVDQFRIVTVGTGGDLTLNHLKITGGQTDGDGGAILVNPGGTLHLHHSTVTRNITGGNGGGIANNGTTRIKDSTISRNTAAVQGGGIYSTGPLKIDKSHIDHNTAGRGGGVFSTDSTVAIKGGSISDNQAGTGGGLFLSSSIGTVTGTRITGNTASSSGGVRAGVGSQLTMRHVSLADNTATSLGAGLSVSGSEEGESTAVVEDSVIKNNMRASSGGGVFNGGQTVLRRTKVIGNQANRGGGIFNEEVISLFATKVVKNVAIADGGGIFNAGGTVNLNTATGTIVTKNRPNNCVDVPSCPG
ncbi:membrane protein [Salinispora arenicola]|uniref:membrane protein n=2 Tax=Salinispora arenicola TaxID=168697 RepID=UPI00035E9BAC|nr:membrane protein [Salinispora arenicola]